MSIEHISAVVLAKNNEQTIQKTLESLKTFQDVVVYDNGSTDKTIQIAQEFSNVNLVKGEFRGFGWSINQAATFAKNEWILIVDSDEVVDKNLLDALNKKDLDKKQSILSTFGPFIKREKSNIVAGTIKKSKDFIIKKSQSIMTMMCMKILSQMVYM